MIKTNLYEYLSRFEPIPDVLQELRDYYLSLPKKTLEGWEATVADTQKLYYLWRHYLKHRCSESVDVNSYPPPIHLRNRIQTGWIMK